MARKAVAPAVLALSIAIGLPYGDVASATGSTCPDADLPASGLTLQAFDDAVFCLINRRRAATAARHLRHNQLLRRAAHDYASSLRKGHFFSHHGDFGGRRTGSTVIGRLREVGYIRRGDAWVVGENLHWTTAERSTPAAVVEAWMGSAIHRKYLLNPKFEELGVGAVRGVPYDDSHPEGITVASEFGFRPVR
jgi:uncharacterized protein YkwD